MSGTLQGAYLKLLAFYTFGYTAILLIVLGLHLPDALQSPTLLIAGFFAVATVVYFLLFFRFVENRFGRRGAYLLGLAIFGFAVSATTAASGGVLSLNNIAALILIFLSAMLGGRVAFAFAWAQATVFIALLGSDDLVTRSILIGLALLAAYAGTAVIGWMTFRKSYTHEDPEAERLRRTLQVEKLQSESVISAIDDGVVILSQDGIVKHVNQKFLYFVNLRLDELLNKHYGQVVSRRVKIVSSSAKDPQLGRNMAEVFKTGKPITIDSETLAYVDREGTVDVSISLMPLKNEDGEVTAVMVIARDISNLMKIQRMKDEFISTASHELRTPITVMAGYLDLILNPQFGALTDKQQHYATRAKSTAVDMTELVNDMLDMNRLESGERENKPEEIKLGKFIDDVTQSNQLRFKEKQLELRHFPKEVTVIADPSRLQQVMDCLLSNAYKFTPANGAVDVIVETTETDARVIIHDNGPGIPADKLDTVFNKFTKLDDSGSMSGTGLGLAIAKRIVEDWNGTIKAEESASGARIVFSIPLTAKQL